MIDINIKRAITTAELREILTLAENQETTDRFTNTELEIDGNNAKISAIIDDCGNITIN